MKNLPTFIQNIRKRWNEKKRDFITRLLQNFADTIIKKMRRSKSDSEFGVFYNMGMSLNLLSITHFNIYLK